MKLVKCAGCVGFGFGVGDDLGGGALVVWRQYLWLMWLMLVGLVWYGGAVIVDGFHVSGEVGIHHWRGQRGASGLLISDHHPALGDCSSSLLPCICVRVDV